MNFPNPLKDNSIIFASPINAVIMKLGFLINELLKQMIIVNEFKITPIKNSHPNKLFITELNFEMLFVSL